MKIKSFCGTSAKCGENKNLDCDLRLCYRGNSQKRFGLKQTLYEILQAVSINVFNKSPIENLFDKPIQQNVKEPFPSNQLKIFE